FTTKIHNHSLLDALPIYLSMVNELKMRVSYGATGNQGINPLESLGRADDLPYIFGGQTVAGAIASSRLPNPNLKWETTATLNIGDRKSTRLNSSHVKISY